MRVFRCYTEKRDGFDQQARSVRDDLRNTLGITGLTGVRLLNRYDAEGISEAAYAAARTQVFSEPQVDSVYDETMPEFTGEHRILAVEALPGQYDQRADSCAQCIQFLVRGDRPTVRAAVVYVFFGALTDGEFDKIRAYLINPVESREAALEKPETLENAYAPPEPVYTLDGFISVPAAEVAGYIDQYGLAMDTADLLFLQRYFRDEEGRDPTILELRLVDTYWSDHCRHTTFGTHLEDIQIARGDVSAAYEKYLAARRAVYGEAAESRPQTLMDIATIAAKALRARGLLQNMDISEEINACSIHVDVNVDGRTEDWLLMFKNETHNHPTEVEPFGGAATCIGGAIRDPLSGRAYVYQAMRVTGAGDPRTPFEDTIPGKLPQKKLTTTAAQGYSSYGNQIGVATGLVHEIYHPGYVAKRMEIGAVVGAVPAANVVRETPAPGDVVILLGGRTGRDGIGGATGSSKTHNEESLVSMASEVQKGNAPEERKIQRLFLDPAVTRMIKRCNDFGAGGVSVAIGELADGLKIDLSKVRKKYDGLSGTEIAISESQERMAVVIAREDVERFIEKASAENLEAYVVAEITEAPRMVMMHEGKVVADLSREFLSSNGTEKRAEVTVPALSNPPAAEDFGGDPIERLKAMLADLRFCAQRGLIERFDSTVGAAGVLAPLGGRTQRTPAQVMAALLPVRTGETSTCSVMSFGFDPYLSERDPFQGARTAVVTSVAKLVAAGCDPDTVYLTFQEYFEKLRREPVRWGKPFSALLGALEAQLELELAAIGGKDSMSGTFMDMDVPPTLVSFAIAPNDAGQVISPEFKGVGNSVVLLPAGRTLAETKEMWRMARARICDGTIVSAWAVTEGGVAEGLFKMAAGNALGFRMEESVTNALLFAPMAGAIIAEVTGSVPGAVPLGRVTEDGRITLGASSAAVAELSALWEGTLEPIFPTRTESAGDVAPILYTGRSPLIATEKFARPRAAIMTFPGTNCELDTARAVSLAGGVPEVVIVKNLTAELLEQSLLETERAIRESQILIFPGGFSGGDEPDGSAKFITAFFRNARIADALTELLRKRDGLVLGICNGFQALVKLGLIPYGEIRTMTADSPTLTLNEIGRHQAKYVYTRVASVNSPWMSRMNPGEVYAAPISHGEGRFIAGEETLGQMAAAGQIATQYCDPDGNVAMDTGVNPNASYHGIEGALSPDGRVFGKMAHTERFGPHVGKNIVGVKAQPVFEGGIYYYK